MELQNVIPEYKVIVIGDIDVGKTCLAFKFCDHQFPEKTVSTIGFDFHQKVISFEEESLKVSRTSDYFNVTVVTSNGWPVVKTFGLG